MKKHLLWLLLLSTISSGIFADDCSCKAISHTYFAVRPQFQIGSPEYEALARNLRKERECGIGMSFQGVVFGGQSTNKKNLGKYFAPYCSNEIPVDGTIGVNSKAILPQHFNIFSVQFSPDTAAVILGSTTPNLTNPFKSIITLNPQQSVIGFGFGWQVERCLGEHVFWASINAPVLHVRNTMGLEETVAEGAQFYTVQPIAGQTTNLNDPQFNMTTALTQTGWNYGKIDNKVHKTTKLGFIQVQVGMNWVDEDCYYFDPYIGATLGVGNKPDARFVFEPIAGNGGHYGVLWGANGGIQIFENCNRDLLLNLETDLVMQYLFANTQKRSMDLKYKPWSRYIETYRDRAQGIQANDLGQAPTTPEEMLQAIFLSNPGINVLTQDVRVKPGFNYTHNMALTLQHNRCCRGFDSEIGYNFYARQAECVSLRKPFGTEAAIKDHVGNGLTNPVRNMTADQLSNEASFLNIDSNLANANANYDRGIISQDDLDLASAAHPCVISHTVYSAIGYRWDDTCFPMKISVGGSYEFAGRMNTSLDRWLVWGKFGIGF
jgi:hypothetical protein